MFLATILSIESNNFLSSYAQTTNETSQQISQMLSSDSTANIQITNNQSQIVVPSNLSTFVVGGNIGSENRDQVSNHILTGGWELAVVNGTLQGFVSGFTMVQEDGSDRNTMTILKVFSGNSSNITLQSQGITIINSHFDVTQNGNLKWSNVPADITIYKASTIGIMFKDQVIRNHFGEEPIHGTVDTIFDPFGERVIVLQ